MNLVENPELAEELLDYLRELLDGKITLPAVDYKRDLAYYHRSELLGCLMLPFLARTVNKDEVPKLNKSRCLYFARGRAVERIFGADNKPVVRDGIVTSVDRTSDNHGLVEMKSTVMSSDNFEGKLRSNVKHWIEECKVVARAYDDTSCNLAVMFLVGNTPSRRWGKPGREAVDLKAWRLDFDGGELDEAWSEMVSRRELLELCVSSGLAPVFKDVKPTVGAWGCGDCQYALFCPYFQLMMDGGKPIEEVSA